MTQIRHSEKLRCCNMGNCIIFRVQIVFSFAAVHFFEAGNAKNVRFIHFFVTFCAEKCKSCKSWILKTHFLTRFYKNFCKNFAGVVIFVTFLYSKAKPLHKIFRRHCIALHTFSRIVHLMSSPKSRERDQKIFKILSAKFPFFLFFFVLSLYPSGIKNGSKWTLHVLLKHPEMELQTRGLQNFGAKSKDSRGLSAKNMPSSSKTKLKDLIFFFRTRKNCLLDLKNLEDIAV